MLRHTLVLSLLLALGIPLLASAEESAWGNFGRRMKEGGKALGDAVSKSVRGKGNAAEWREVGDGFKGAGKAGGEAVEQTAETTAEKVDETVGDDDVPAAGGSATEEDEPS